MAVFNNNKCFIAFLAIACVSSTSAYTNSHDLRRNFAGMGSIKKSPSSNPSLYGPHHPSSTSQDSLIGKKSSEPHQQGLAQAAINIDAGFAAAPGRPRRSPPSSPLPNAAHGMLSPEIVARMDENILNGRSNPAVDEFLRTYRRKGPMSCLEMLSDPEILPHLTQAMRDIV
eukprot:CAMPEP_0201127804 /NCGR_PEP_ID=MMETSP0850-20130426/31582_1 /ASSEMBLY_ACC=CAM_ASM_000622 /TAXON_ID=183588 /ORGANISM="Pseudo-nitzschia fraudulenta, Strain WWA7" /LENGTH=170 /DNA_ID=CAMNT_0047396769 /DNA_START=119 /DNA_END=631 /DNA_ORIENTATION=-